MAARHISKGKTKKRGRGKGDYRVFISHSSEDMWIAQQLANAVEAVGAKAFLDVRDIAHGDDFRTRIEVEMPKCRELLALFTPWSRQRWWVRHEIGMAASQRLRTICVFYHLKPEDFPQEEGGLGPIERSKIVDINEIDAYLKALAKRVSNR